MLFYYVLLYYIILLYDINLFLFLVNILKFDAQRSSGALERSILCSFSSQIDLDRSQGCRSSIFIVNHTFIKTTHV